ncbi:hypothetical protein RRG08_009689 [Elysia crispata]|uniref:Uncharacterized protein n=1 Tax=Elysia crispata TaxID=231223 RepID=A0AAE0XVP4_9GAST|nr:hypothetical protein RRG08_009689 [Elysia crispata]
MDVYTFFFPIFEFEESVIFETFEAICAQPGSSSSLSYRGESIAALGPLVALARAVITTLSPSGPDVFIKSMGARRLHSRSNNLSCEERDLLLGGRQQGLEGKGGMKLKTERWNGRNGDVD